MLCQGGADAHVAGARDVGRYLVMLGPVMDGGGKCEGRDVDYLLDLAIFASIWRIF